MSSIIDIIKKVAVEVMNERATEVRFGNVTSVEPLKIKINDTLELTDKNLRLDAPVELNEEVILIKYTAHDRFLVLSTITKVYHTTTNIGGTVGITTTNVSVDTGYATADKVWMYFKNRGFTDEATAGIIGNMMREVGGDTLNLKGTISATHGGIKYYGLCMWSLRYFPQVDGKSVDWQIEYLHNEFMPYQFKLRAKHYKNGFTVDQFKKMTNAEEAAKAFAIIVENPGQEGDGTYPRRRKNALTAYNNYHK